MPVPTPMPPNTKWDGREVIVEMPVISTIRGADFCKLERGVYV